MRPMEIDTSIDVDLPVRSVYNEWTMFEEFPKFMEGVEYVEQLTPDRLHWVANIGGRRREWDARIIEQIPDRRIVWQSDSGEPNVGAVEFRPINDDKTRVSLHMEYDPHGFIETTGDAIGLVRRRVEGDLHRFKNYIESIGHEAGGWRGTFRAEPSERARAREMASKAGYAGEVGGGSLLSDALTGALGGFLGSLPLTFGALWTKAQRPWYERTALRQVEVTEHLVTRMGFADRVSDRQMESLALALHTGFGVSMGALYGMLAGRSRLPAFVSGGLWGAAVWSGSYLGWIPQAKLARSAKHDTPEMNATMFSSNVLWGMITSLTVAGFRRRPK